MKQEDVGAVVRSVFLEGETIVNLVLLSILCWVP